MPKLYSALMKISSMRSELGRVREGLADVEAARYLSRIQDLEAKAVRLLDEVESGSRAVRH